MTDILLSVRRSRSGWVVDCPDGFEPLEFASPGEAEDKAKLLARCLAEAGVDVRVLIQDAAQHLGASR